MPSTRRLRYILCCLPRALYGVLLSSSLGGLDATSVSSPAQWTDTMDRNSHPNTGLATRSGWVGAVARFYQVWHPNYSDTIIEFKADIPI